MTDRLSGDESASNPPFFTLCFAFFALPKRDPQPPDVAQVPPARRDPQLAPRSPRRPIARSGERRGGREGLVEDEARTERQLSGAVKYTEVEDVGHLHQDLPGAEEVEHVGEMPRTWFWGWVTHKLELHQFG